VEQHRVRAEQCPGQVCHARAAGAVPADRRDHGGPAAVDDLLRQLVGSHSGQHRDLHLCRPLQPGDPWGEAKAGGGGAEPLVEGLVVTGGNLAQVRPAQHQVVGRGPKPAGDHQPAGNAAVGQRRSALLGQRQLWPAVDADAGEEGAGRGGHRVAGEHAGRLQVGAVGGDQLFDVGAPR
jgi:hypothetical protein